LYLHSEEVVALDWVVPNQCLHLLVLAPDQMVPNLKMHFQVLAPEQEHHPKQDLHFQVLVPGQELPSQGSHFQLMGPDQAQPTPDLNLQVRILPSPCFDFLELVPNWYFGFLALALE
jgi:hypothetical protein